MRKKTPYLYEVGEVVNKNLKIIEQIRTKNGKYSCKGYLVQSLEFPNAKPYETREGNLKQGKGCAYTSGQRICEDNSLYSIENIRANIVDVELAKKIAPKSDKYILFKCKNKHCKETKKLQPKTLVTYGFSCPNCSSNISYPERFMLAVDKYFNLEFEYQQNYTFGRFDFINHDTKIVVEMNGIQHYKKEHSTSKWSNAHNKTIESDNKKRKWCEENGYDLVFIDARKSEFEFIRKNINNELLLPNIKEEDVLSIINLIAKYNEYNTESVIKLYEVDKLTIKKISNNLNLGTHVVKSILKKNNVKLRNLKKKVKCLESGVIYESCQDAMRKTGIANSSISNVCKGKRKTAGGYHWEYVEEE